MAPMLDSALIKRLSSSPPLPGALSPAPHEVTLKSSPGSPLLSTTANSSPAPRNTGRSSSNSMRPDSVCELVLPVDQVKAPSGPRSARPRPASRQSDKRLEEVSEKPQPPYEVMSMKAVARNRSPDLQNIFTSRHSDKSVHLRGRLGTLNAQAAELRARIVSLEQELQEANAERLKDMHRVPSDERLREAKELRNVAAGMEGGDTKDGTHILHAVPKCLGTPRHRSSGAAQHQGPDLDKLQTEATGDGPEGALKALLEDSALHAGFPTDADAFTMPMQAGDRSPYRSESKEAEEHAQLDSPTSRPQSGQADKRYQDEVLMPLLVRRRAEARFKEASYVHETSINQMKAEMQEIERRSVKQTNWMKQVEAQVLKVELTKAAYQVRLDSSRKRVQTLGSDLSDAYENMTTLLEDRLDVEDVAAKNDALLWYLHTLGIADNHHAEKFIDNKTDLLLLNQKSARLRAKRSQLDDLCEELRSSQVLAQDITKHSEELAHLSEQLHQLWNLVPADWKDSGFKAGKQLVTPTAVTSMHPVNAIQSLQGSSSHVNNAMKSYLRALAEFEDRKAKDKSTTVAKNRKATVRGDLKIDKLVAFGHSKTMPEVGKNVRGMA